MKAMFYDCDVFNQDINTDSNRWNTSKVEIMAHMFWGCHEFDGNITGWDINNVTDMYAMFYRATVFNQDIGVWNVSGYVDFASMFMWTNKFNQNLTSWTAPAWVPSYQSNFAAMLHPGYTNFDIANRPPNYDVAN